MVMDFRERSTVNKNRPRRQPAGIFFFSIFVAVIIAYTLGLVTGWLVFRPGEEMAVALRTAPSAGNDTAVQVPTAGKEQPAPENTGNIKEPMLEFYEKLPKGNRELIGSGLNLPRTLDQPVAKAVPPQPPQRPAPAPREASSGGNVAQSGEAEKAPVKPAESPRNRETPAAEGAVKGEQGKGKFVVQVASYQDRNEAEELRDRLKGSGMQAYIVESNIPEKGTYYRVRVGRHLDQKAAQDMAEKVGKGSIVIPQ